MTQSKTIRPYKRRIYYINKDYQRNFIIKFCVLTGLCSILAMGFVFWLAMNSTTVAIRDGRVAVHSTADYLLPLMAQTVLFEVILVSIVTVALTMIMSFRIAGPLYRFKMMLQGLAQGDFSTQMHLRSDDQLKVWPRPIMKLSLN